MLKIKSDNPNYLARLVRISGLRKHSNADRLQCVSLLGNNLITGLNSKDGDLMVYFPLECAINLDYLAHSNSLDDPESNRDKTTKGFFSKKHGRVKALKLRNERSEGYLAPASTVEEWSGYKFTEDDIDKDFDFIGDLKICEKYVNREQLRKQQQQEQRAKKSGKVKRESRLVDNQFRLHIDTQQLKRNISNINPNDYISISYKMHGTSGVFGKVLCKRSLSWKDKIAKWFGTNIQDTHYDLLFSSRKVIKNAYADKESKSFYSENIWEIVANEIKDKIRDGISLYCEIVNQLPNGSWIQKNYDYGYLSNQHGTYIYRITYTSPSGDVYEFTPKQVERYCNKMGLNMVPLIYYGQAISYINHVKYNGEYCASYDNFHEEFLETLIENHTEKDCYMCKNKVPQEGVVIVKEGEVAEAYKLKSFKFLLHESSELDSGEVNIEDSN